MATVMQPTQAEITAPGRVLGGMRLTHPTRGYSVTRNPFAVWEVLPVVTLAFAGLAMALTYINDAGNAELAAGAFLVVTLGMLLVPAISQKGSLNLTHDGITFSRGKDHFTAGWDQVSGVVNRRDAGLCMIIRNPQSTRQGWRLPGGFHVRDGQAQVPLRFFGDRQFSILYDLRDRLPDATWRPALEATVRPTWRILATYAGTVAVCALAIVAVALAIS